MRESYWAYWLVLLGVFVIGVMMLVNNISTTNTQDYYNIKEVTQASMIDAVDFSYYRLYGNIKMSEAKFVENFTRRFVENINMANTYDVKFYDLYEVPPKVSVKVSTGSRSFNIANSRNDYDVVTTINAILDIGTLGEVSGANKSKEKSLCAALVGTNLLRYLKGESVDGHLITEDAKNDSVLRNALNDIMIPENLRSKINTSDDLSKIIKDGTIKYNNQSLAHYLATTDISNYPTFIKAWIDRGNGWIDFMHK